jgi:prevent-host-death family protein
MTSINITKARAKFNQIVSEVNEYSQPITITNNRGKNAVLIGEEDWKAIQEMLCLNSIPGLSQSILASKEKKFPINHLFNE